MFIIYMSMSNNIVLNIKTGDSLSLAIDRELDKQLKTDVKLGFSEWSSVFNLIKRNQVSTNKAQFGEKDTDIRNGKHFVVHANENYEISANVWSQIVEIAKKKMGISTPQASPSAEQPTEAPKEAAEDVVLTNEQKVSNILKEANLSVSEAEYSDILNKYENILAFAQNNSQEISDEKIAERLINYANGLKFHAKETEFAQTYAQNGTSDAKIENTGVKEAMNSGSMENFKAAFHKMAKEYIETYDNAAGDGKIDIQELIAMEEKELGRALTPEEKAIVQEEAINRMKILDQSGDNKLDENEIAAYLWAMSKINDGENGKTADDITFEEWKTSQNSMGIFSGLDLTATQKETVNIAFKLIAKTNASLDKLYEMKDLSGLNLTADEQNVLKTALPLLAENGFNQEMIDNYGKFNQALKNGYAGLK